MKNRWIALGMAVVLSLGTLVGCAGTSAESPVDAVTLGKAVAEADTTLPEMTTNTSEGEDAELSFSAVCNVDYSRVEGYYHSFATDGTAPEIIVVIAKDTTDVTAILTGIKDHVATRKGTMEEYSPEQVATVEKAVITYKGRYIACFISDKSNNDKATFEEELAKYGIQ